MGKRHETLGIKQTLRYEWMQKTTNLLLSGLDAKTIRAELHEFLAERKGDGSIQERGKTSRAQVVNMLMNIWITPNEELIGFRDRLLLLLKSTPGSEISVHWAMISAAYPFWFNVATQVGRLLNLQDQVTLLQITNRLKEEYGDRQTVCRYTRCVVRSFIAWGVLNDLKVKGCYEGAKPIAVNDHQSVVLLLEAALHTNSEGKGALTTLLNTPAYFPFQIQAISGDLISQLSGNNIDALRFEFGDEMVKLVSLS